VATQLSGGHAQNALPQLASATVNCRILPVEKPDDIQKTLEGVLADPTIKISRLAEPVLVQQKPMDPKVLKLVKDASQKIWPGVPMIIYLQTGATDSKYLCCAPGSRPTMSEGNSSMNTSAASMAAMSGFRSSGSIRAPISSTNS
jgi:acetylornithine deacetylase/succinyl-diaminopimelate desuccinylase-like protein